MGVAGGLENVEEREEKSRTGDDIATDMLEGSQRNRGQGWKVVKTRKLRPKGTRSFILPPWNAPSKSSC